MVESPDARIAWSGCSKEPSIIWVRFDSLSREYKVAVLTRWGSVVEE
jgi:hypothetical protein